ncbi:MAG: hypothetical protein GX442_01195 [Candidatus Riflebacteria bacterium]|nr:hypothetical protein [Candidatus Riflebacteria bacterium]
MAGTAGIDPVRVTPVPAATFTRLDLEPDGPHRILIPSSTVFHSLCGAGIVIGAVLLFMVVASLTQMRAPGGKVAPPIQGSTAFLLVCLGGVCLGSGLVLRQAFSWFTVVDLGRRRFLQQGRFGARVVWEGPLVDFSRVTRIIVYERTAHVSADTLTELLWGWLRRPGSDAGGVLGTLDSAVVVEEQGGARHEVVPFANAKGAGQLALDRARFLVDLLHLQAGPGGDVLVRDGDPPKNPAWEATKWILLVIGLLIPFVMLMNAARD